MILPRKSLLLALSILPGIYGFTAALGAEDTTKTPVNAPHQIVEVKLKGTFSEDPKAANPFGPQAKNFRGLLDELRAIAKDPSVVGVKLIVEDVPDFARSLDLLDQLRAVKAAGKKIVSYAEGLSQRSLMFASVADELWLPPSGQITLEGLAIQPMYLKNLLAMLDVEMKIVHIGEYKTAYEDYARDSMSPQQREVIEHLLNEYWSEMLDAIAHNRGIGREVVEKAFDSIFVTAGEAQKMGLVTNVGYEDEFDARCTAMFSGATTSKHYGESDSKAELDRALENPIAAFALLPKLLNPPKVELKAEPRIAIVYASGAIQSGKSAAGLNGEVTSMGSETIVEALEAALNDDWVKAVVLRINSPGGSALASDMIWRATQRVKAKKPIIASMGGVAGSGGYWIAMGCDKIIAQPSTITGSIGVVGMLPDVSKALKRFGVNVESVGKGPHVEDLALMKNGPTEALQQRLRESMEGVYGEFIKKVSSGRGLPQKNVEAFAKGRVWTGREALDIGLVDQLGGLDDAIAMACKAANGLDPKTTPIVELPAAKNFGDTIQDLMDQYATVRSPVALMLEQLGLSTVAQQIDVLAHNLQPGGADAIQAVMPLFVTAR